jgi:outer membrane protein assembly factor BamB
MKLRTFLATLTILVVIAGNIQLVSSQASDPALTPVFKVPIKEDEIKPRSPGAYIGSTQGLWVWDNAVYCIAVYGNVIVKMDISTKKVSIFYEAETNIANPILHGILRSGDLWLIGLDYTPIPGKNEGTHITLPPGAGAIIAVNMTTKRTVWSFPTKYPPIVFGMRNDLIYFRVYDEGIYALNVSTRKVRWLYPELPDKTSSTGKMGFYSLLLDQDTVYATASRVMVAIDSTTGREKFRVNIENGFLDGLVVKDNVLYGTMVESGVGGNTYNVSYIAFNLSTKSFTWQTYLSSYQVGTAPIITGDSIYVVALDDRNSEFEPFPQRICALNASSGKIRWRTEYNDLEPMMLLSQPYLYAVERVDLDRGQQGSRHSYHVINAYNTSDGEKVWSYRLGSTDYPGAANEYWKYGTAVYDAILYNNTLILSGSEGIYKEDPGLYAPSTFYIWGFKSQSAEPVPEFPNRSLILAASILALIPMLFRSKRRLV